MKLALPFQALPLAALSLAFLASRAPLLGDDTPATYPSDGGLAAKLQPLVESNLLPGGVVLIADKEKILDLEAFGYSDLATKTPMKTDSLFMIASMTKMLTSTALMMLVEEGKVNLDDPVEKYIPAFKGQVVADPKDPAHPHPVQHPSTVRQVMSHTAGIPHGTHPKDYTSLENDVNLLAKLPLLWAPGAGYQYSEGPEVGGRIIEIVSGIPYPDFIKQRLLDPLGMKETSFWPDAALASRLALTADRDADGHKLKDHPGNDALLKDPAKSDPVPLRLLSQMNADVVTMYRHHVGRPDGGLFSTALDMAKFGQMLLNQGTSGGKTYVAPVSVKEMATIQTGDLTASPDQAYGLCTMIVKKSPSGYLSVGSYGHRGARKTEIWIDPAHELVLILMTQLSDLKNEQQKVIDKAFIIPAIAKYGKAVK